MVDSPCQTIFFADDSYLLTFIVVFILAIFKIVFALFHYISSFVVAYYTGCLNTREFRIQSVVGDHFSCPNLEIKKNRDSSLKDTLV
jgi:hypothetical protein